MGPRQNPPTAPGPAPKILSPYPILSGGAYVLIGDAYAIARSVPACALTGLSRLRCFTLVTLAYLVKAGLPSIRYVTVTSGKVLVGC